MGLVEESFFFPYRLVQALIKYGTPQGAQAAVKAHPDQQNKDAHGRFEVHHTHRGFLVPWYFGSTSEYVTETVREVHKLPAPR